VDFAETGNNSVQTRLLLGAFR